MAKYCLILHCPDLIGNPNKDYRKDPGAGHLVDIKYGDTAEELWFYKFRGLKYQLYALDTGERVGNDIYCYGCLSCDIEDAEMTKREFPDISWLPKYRDNDTIEY